VHERTVTLEKVEESMGATDWPTPLGPVRTFVPSTGLQWRLLPAA
jgi:hypothetical protein